MTIPSAGRHSPLYVRCWGTRGSYPSPGEHTLHFGGNTSCLEVRASDDHTLIFDAGTGIRALGAHLEGGGERDVHLFLTHFHWDHIQGLPAFAPLYVRDARVCLHGPAADDGEVHAVVERLFESDYFPVPDVALAAAREYRASRAVTRLGDVEISSIAVPHSRQLTLGYRIRRNGVAVAYVPDCELSGNGASPGTGAHWYDDMVEFLRGTDVLFHDAMFTTTEYAARRGWGHSTFEQAIRLAEDAAVGRLCAFHHAPDRTDDELTQIRDAIRAELRARGSGLEFDVAAEMGYGEVSGK